MVAVLGLFEALPYYIHTYIMNLPADKGRPARKADNLTAICEPIV
jgi:hypothetical protein